MFHVKHFKNKKNNEKISFCIVYIYSYVFIYFNFVGIFFLEIFKK